MTEGPSQGADIVARLVPALSLSTCRQLRALLADHIATNDVLGPAHHTLLGVAALIDTLGHVPSIAEYEHARIEQPTWPHHGSLSRGYGSWLRAVSAAVKLTNNPPRHARPAQQPRRSHRRADCVTALQRCRVALGDWPTASEYQRWQVIEADLCRRTGITHRTPPSETVVRNRLGTWSEAIGLARGPV